MDISPVSPSRRPSGARILSIAAYQPITNLHMTSNRRALIKMLGLGSVASLLSTRSLANPSDRRRPSDLGARPISAKASTGGLPPVTIRSVKAIGTAPQGANLVIVKVETSEPGLYGVGCATFTQRAEVIVTAINNYMPDFCRGR